MNKYFNSRIEDYFLEILRKDSPTPQIKKAAENEEFRTYHSMLRDEDINQFANLDDEHKDIILHPSINENSEIKSAVEDIIAQKKAKYVDGFEELPIVQAINKMIATLTPDLEAERRRKELEEAEIAKRIKEEEEKNKGKGKGKTTRKTTPEDTTPEDTTPPPPPPEPETKPETNTVVDDDVDIAYI